MYEAKIRMLEESYRLVDNQLFQLEKTGKADPEQIKKLQEQKNKYLNELRELRKKQYDQGQTVDFGDD
jgi:DNA-directed RNA polymerase alpha subunit